MYLFLDRPVTSLDHGGRFLVWAMRSWVTAVGEQRCPLEAIDKAFARWNMVTGLTPFLRMMTLFNRHGLETFQFCGLPCNHVSEHEAIIISLVCDLRDGRPDMMRATLLLLVEETAVGELMTILSALGRAMEDATVFPGRGGWVPGRSCPDKAD